MAAFLIVIDTTFATRIDTALATRTGTTFATRIRTPIGSAEAEGSVWAKGVAGNSSSRMAHSALGLAAFAVAGLAAAAGVAVPAKAVDLYANTAIEAPIRYNPSNPNVIVFDDIPIPVSLLKVAGRSADFVEVDAVTVGIRRLASSPPVAVSLFAAGFQSGFLDSAFGVDLSSIRYLGGQTLPTSISSPITTPVSLFLAPNPVQIPLVYFGDYGYLALGVAFSNPSASNGWRVMASTTNDPFIGCDAGVGLGPSNLGCFWEVDSLSGTEFVYTGFNTSIGAVAGAFYAQVNGRPTLVPTPGPLPLLGALAAFSAARRLRRRQQASQLS